jgi:hypothetical protein
MTEQEASLIIRMEMALADEGIGAKNPSPEDSIVIATALKVAGHLFDEHYDLWEAGLIPGTAHIPRCDKPHYTGALHE